MHPTTRKNLKTNILRIALIVGAVGDIGIAIFCWFFQALLGPVLDVPTKDPALTTIAGGEYLIVGILYILAYRNLKQYRPLLWLFAIDQLFAIVLPLLEMSRGNAIISWKTLGPMPLNAILLGIYVWGTRLRSETA